MATLLKNHAYNLLVEMIFSGEIEPRKIYSLTKIAQDLNISRTPLRDAIQILSDEKRVDILPSRGFCLHQPSEEEIKQRYHLTISLEGYAIVRLTEKYKNNPQDKYIKHLENCLLEMETKINVELPFKEQYPLDNEFHKTLIDSLDDNFPEYLSLKDHCFINIPELHLYAPSLDLHVMLEFNKKILQSIKDGNFEIGYSTLIANGDYVYKVYMDEYRSKKSEAKG